MEELFDIKTTDEVVLCSYAWHSTWLMETMRLDSVKSTWTVDPKCGESEIARLESNRRPRKYANRTIHRPPHLRLYGVCHAKFIILFRKNGTLRVIVTSANLTPVEWGHEGPADARRRASTLMDNVVFVVDLPLRTTTVTSSTRPDFQTVFHDFLQCLQVQPSLLAAIDRYDFSACAHLGFVYTGGPRATVSGFESLRRAVACLGLAPARQYTHVVPYVCYSTSTISRIGDMFTKWLFSAIRDREPEEVDVQNAISGLHIRYPSRSTALTAPNSDLRRMFYLKEPGESHRMHSILDQCLVDTGKGKWLSHAKTMQIQWW
ncbi:Tyrosyl-DNA phosphodiesterase [Pyrenophora tritici-repentis]|nr:Tyrosyl-DNA phosphodiesterase [Pyrenophora tritici-repentis]KAI0604362.1 Tyrosyl-DNA phosphodiesterase [Pyrenophora tritici-repentis]KAI0616602.1 Tyrosyl-DNA phosphodiesterase [Pyrenophora tritici-repentis]